MPTDRSRADRLVVNNAWYDSLRWGDEENSALALLRLEGALKNEWVAARLADRPGARVLDVGCGGGFLTNHLAKAGFEVTGVDVSEGSLAQARAADQSGRARYQTGDAYALPFAENSFDAVTCLDFLEHVTAPHLVVAEAARVLKRGGLFFFHTFNRNLISSFLAVKGLEWFVKGTPERLHVSKLFITPGELDTMMKAHSLERVEQRGLRPVLNASFFKLVFTGRVTKGFAFRWTDSPLISYAGFSLKR